MTEPPPGWDGPGHWIHIPPGQAQQLQQIGGPLFHSIEETARAALEMVTHAPEPLTAWLVASSSDRDSLAAAVAAWDVERRQSTARGARMLLEFVEAKDQANLWAAPRDASWYDYPRTRGVPRIHVADDTDRYGVSSCGNRPLDETQRQTLDQVPVDQRCQRRGCREKWPTPEETDVNNAPEELDTSSVRRLDSFQRAETQRLAKQRGRRLTWMVIINVGVLAVLVGWIGWRGVGAQPTWLDLAVGVGCGTVLCHELVRAGRWRGELVMLGRWRDQVNAELHIHQAWAAKQQ